MGKRGLFQRMLGRGWVDPQEQEQTSGATGTEIMPLTFETSEVRLILIRGEPWWVLADVARVLGYCDTNAAGRLLYDHHKGTTKMRTPGGTQDVIIISESGLYRLIMRSNKAEAERFQEWVTGEVLPSIRKTGRYDGTPIRSWIKKRGKQYGHGMGWQRNRQKVADGNKTDDALTFKIGGNAVTCSERYNALYRGLFGKVANALKAMLGTRPKDSPLDQCGDYALASYGLASAAWREKVKQGLISADEIESAAESIGVDVRTFMAKQLGPEYEFKPVDGPKGHKILEPVRQLPRSTP